MLETLRLLLDFGLMILIWMVQLLIYPSFAFYTKENLVKWHKKYTGRIALVVIPLMLGQLIITTYQLINYHGVYEISSMAIVLFLWCSTFLQFVPLHNSIGKAHKIRKSVEKLIRKNWTRTILWTFLFVVTAWNYF